MPLATFKRGGNIKNIDMKNKNFKKSFKSFTVIELTIYIALFGVLTFVFFNIFGDVLNLNKLVNKQNSTLVRYNISPIELDLDFPKKVIIPQNPGKLFPNDPPVKLIPGNTQYCSFQWVQKNCDLDGAGSCLVCDCTEIACNDVNGCEGCHQNWVPDPENSENCTCVDVKSELASKWNYSGDVFYWYPAYNSSSTLYAIPVSSSQVVISNPIPPIGKNYFTMDLYNHYAWNDNSGWWDLRNIVFNTDTNHFSGNAIILSGKDQVSFSCSTTNSCNDSNYQVTLNQATSELEGYAWGENVGWVSFNCKTGGDSGSNICGTSNYKVTLDQATGEWDGYAWSENLGWISFNCKTGGQSQASVCSTSNYKVQDNRNVEGIIQYKFDAIVDGESVSVTEDYKYNTYRESTLGAISHTQGTVGTDFTISSIAGSYFLEDPKVELVKPGSLPIVTKTNCTFVSQDSITNCVFDLRGASTGVYDLRVIDSFGNVSLAKKAITIK